MEWSAFLKYLLVMAGVTYLIRMLPLAAIRSKVKSPFVRSFLYYVPYAVLGALVLGWMGKSLLTVAAAACVAALAAGMLLP